MIDIVVEVFTFLARAMGRSRDRERPERLFREVVEPVQEDLLRIQDDYTENFIRLSEMVADPSIPVAEIEKHVRNQRKRFNPLRTEAGELAIALTNLLEHKRQRKEPKPGSADQLLHEYTDAVIDYLYGDYVPRDCGDGDESADDDPTVDTDLRMATRYTDFMKVVKAAPDAETKRACLAELVTETERDLERSWRALSTRYGQLKARCLL